MIDPRSPHLSPDEIDLWLEQHLPLARMSHIETCSECREAAEETRDIVNRLAALPRAALPYGFSARVLAALSAAGAPVSAGEHLTADDLDLWIGGILPASRQRHLLACADCRKLADAERLLVMRLQALPLFEPAPGFPDRVLSRVHRLQPVWVRGLAGVRRRAFASRRSMAAAAGIAALVLASMGGSVAWSLAHQDTIASIGAQLSSGASQWFWVGLRTLASNLIEQPWYDELRAAATPGRMAGIGAGFATLYTGGLLAMRRLLTAPAPVVRALP